MTRTTWRLRLVATCLVLTAVAFSQSPGLIAADTKLDLTQNPGGFLLRSLQLWDDQAFFGQLQNQAYGYLWPVGPFFWLGHALALPDWAVQRVWWSLLLCIGFLGAVRLARLVGVPSPAARWVGGLVFVLSPRVMSTLGPISVETLPYVLAPWVLIPLVRIRHGSSVRRAAALSGVAIVFMSGVNAVATVAAAALGVVWIVTESTGAARRRMLCWWLGCAALASAWFLGPLLVLGRYSPPFLDWIESAAVTTSITDGSATLRGVTDWVAYVGGRGGPTWPAGWQLVSERVLVVATVGVALVGLVGLVLRRTRHRRFLVASVVLGMLALVAAHVSAGGAWADGVLAPYLRDLLDGVLAPLRNVHKFDVWVRLPLALGVAWSVSELARVAGNRRRGRAANAGMPTLREWWPGWRSAGATVAVVGAAASLAGASLPALRTDLTVERTFASVPGYWLEAAGWLGSTEAQGRALVLPGASFGIYLWGSPRDEPLQPYAESPWAVRDAVPLSSAGNIRTLDAVESLLSDGRGAPGLAAYLERAGVRFVVVRNDLDLGRVDAPRPSLVHQSLARSGGFVRMVGFGPVLQGYSGSELVADGGIDGAYQAVEIYSVVGALNDRRVVLRDASTVSLLGGEAEGVLQLSSRDGPFGAAVRPVDLPPGLASSATTVGAATDSARRWEIDFGRVQDHASSSLAPDAPWRLDRRVHDYLVTPAAPGPEVVYPGYVSVADSSSRGDASSLVIDPASGPWNAVDEVASTAWVPRGSQPVGQWWQLSALEPVALRGARLVPTTIPGGGRGSVTLDVTTDTGTEQVEIPLPVAGVNLPSSLGNSRTLRLTIRASTLAQGYAFGIAELTVPGLSTSRALALEAINATTSDLALSTRTGRRAACVIKEPVGCFGPQARIGEEDSVLDRVVTTSGIDAPPVLTVEARGSAALDRLLEPPGRAALASASSTWVPDPVARPQAAIDRDPSTAWLASPLDPRPTLTIRLPRPTTLSYVRITEALGLAASRPLGVTVSVGRRSYPVFSDEAGYLRFPATRTSSIRLEVTSSRPTLSYDTRTGVRNVLPVGISDLTLGEADVWRRGLDPDAVVGLPCGFGPTIRIGDREVLTSVTTDVRSLLDAEPVVARPCTPGSLPAGTQRVVVASTAEFWVTGLNWSIRGASTASVAAPTVRTWTSTVREVDVTPVDSVRTLELGENSNQGWVATLDDGTELAPVRVDGWRQAWLVPAGVGGAVTLRFAPSTAFHSALVLGLLAVVLLLGLALRRPAAAVPVPSDAARRLPVRPWVRMLGTAVATAVALGPLAVATALLAQRWRGARARAVLVLGGALVATAPAVLAPWPAATTWAQPAQQAAAVVVAAGTGVVVGALVGPGRRRRPEAQR